MVSKLRKLLLKLFVFSVPNTFISPIPLLSFPFFVLLLYFIISLPYLLKGITFKKIRNPLLAIIAMYFLVLIVSILNYIPNPYYSLSFLRQFPIYLVLVIIVSDAINKGLITVREIIVYYLLGFSIIVFQFIFGINLMQGIDGRTTIGGINSNKISFLSSIAVLFSIELYSKLKRNTFPKGLLVLTIIIAVYIAILTGSRGGFIGLIIGLLMFFYFNSTNSKRKASSFLKGLFLTSVITIFFLSNNLIYSRIFGMGLKSEGDRLDIWPQFLGIFYKSPFFGVGVFESEFLITNMMGYNQATHNEFITILIYSGLTGLFFFLIFLYYASRNAIIINKEFNSPLYISLFAMALFHLFKGGGAILSVYTWFLFSLILSSKYEIHNRFLYKIKKNTP